jgi:hypothetical protein
VEKDDGIALAHIDIRDLAIEDFSTSSFVVVCVTDNIAHGCLPNRLLAIGANGIDTISKAG